VAVGYFAFWSAMHRDALDEAERLARARAASTDPEQRARGLWHLVLALRNQGRLREALQVARTRRGERAAAYVADGRPVPAVHGIPAAIILLEAGRAAESARAFEALAAGVVSEVPEVPASGQRSQAWMLTHAATARAAAGDTLGLRARVDDVAAVVRRAGLQNPHYLHYPAGLLAAARGRIPDAVAELRASITAPVTGYTRANLVLARLLLAHGRAAEAVAVLQPALRGELEAWNYYVTRTELHEGLAQAWDAVAHMQPPDVPPAAAPRDSAVAHYRVVAASWRRGDPALAARAAAAAARATALSPR
jgi:hypothetical protein